MTTIVLNEQTAKTPLGDVLHSAAGSEIRIMDTAGRLIARLTFAAEPALGRMTPKEIEMDIDELQRRAAGDRSGDLTTAELLERLRALTPEDHP